MDAIKDNPHGGYASPIPAKEFQRLRDEEQAMPHHRVTKHDLVERLLAAGWPLRKALTQAEVAESIGCYTRIGDEMFAVMTAKQLFAY